MASNKNLLRLSSQQSFMGELSLSSFSDNQIKKPISFTHPHSDKKFDVNSLFAVVKNILDPATNVVDSVFHGTKQVHQETHVEIAYEVNWIPQSCTLKQLYCEMACKAPGVEIAQKTTSVLSKLKDYSWDEKAVLALAAFAMEYGEFCHLAHYHSSDPLTKSLGILRHVPAVLMPPGIEKHGKSIDELNSLIRHTLEVIECIFKLEELSTQYDTNDVPALSNDISVGAYRAIISAVVACSTQMCSLIDNENKKPEFPTFVRQISITFDSILEQKERCDLQIVIIEAYRKLKRFLQNPTDIVGVLKALLFAGKTASEMDISHIESLKTKHVLLFFTGLDISDEDISILKPIYEKISKEDQYKLMWIPIVEQWTEEIEKKFEVLESKMPPCYRVRRFSSVSSIKYIKEQWHFENRPIMVVLNPQGTLEHQNAWRMLTLWGPDYAFPLTIGNEKKLSTGKNWFVPIMYDISREVSTLIKEEKYIFFCGGEDKNWIQKFTETAKVVVSDPVLGEKKFSRKIFCVGNDSKSKDDSGIQRHFWNRLENFFSMLQEETELDEMTQVIQKEILKSLSYKTQKGWVILCKGSTFVFSGYGTIVLTIMEKFSEWKENLHKDEFESCIKERYIKLLEVDCPCSCFDIPANNGMIRESLKCPHCSREMKKYIRFECCHDKEPGETKALH